MGRGARQKSLYVSASEWKSEWGGFKDKSGRGGGPIRVPFNCCALSLSPFQDACCTAEGGAVFDLMNAAPYVLKHGVSPISGKPMKVSELIRLQYHRNSEGEYHCPVLCKVFTPHTHIVAIRGAGSDNKSNVYSFEAVNELCLKAKNLRDLLTDAPFKRSDVITLHDPSAPPPAAGYHWRREGHAVPSRGGKASSSSDIRVGGDAQRIMASVKEAARRTTPSDPRLTSRPAQTWAAIPRKPGTATWDTSGGAVLGGLVDATDDSKGVGEGAPSNVPGAVAAKEDGNGEGGAGAKRRRPDDPSPESEVPASKAAREEMGRWFSGPGPSSAQEGDAGDGVPGEGRTGVGRFLPAATQAKPKAMVGGQAKAKANRKGGGYGNFDAW